MHNILEKLIKHILYFIVINRSEKIT